MQAGAVTLTFVYAETATGPGSPHKAMDEARFEAFYRKTSGSVWAYLNRLCGDATTADDLLQKAYIRFLRADPGFASEDHMRRYLFRTATSVALDHFRETKRRLERETIAEAIAPLNTSDLRFDMLRAFKELKPQERALLWLAHVEESDHEEIGEALGVKTKSVKVLLFRARKKLAELLTRRGIGPEVLS
jgi:RNA polymerase sigma-70 factor, ECF subfamily